ncbi:lactate utilization protein C [Acidobacteriota bacterium]
MSETNPSQLIKTWEDAGGKGHVVPLKDLQVKLIEIIRQSSARTVAIADSLIVKENNLNAFLTSEGLEVILPYQPTNVHLAKAMGLETDRETYINNLSRADLGISEATYGIGDTGTLAMVDRSGLGDPVSLLPPVSIALLRLERVVNSFKDILPVFSSMSRVMLAPGNGLVLITGPSRTADIEQVLIKGVHGPRIAHLVILW